jgi:dTDP-4-dehydrorhamnose 3,5-epimerase
VLCLGPKDNPPVQFIETEIPGVLIVEAEVHRDVRGLFTRTWSEREFREHGCDPAVVECNVSFNHRAGTLRGMHYQAAPHAQVKVVRCTRGAVWDAVIDLRPGSPTFKKYIGVELTARNHRQVYIPGGIAHGFITLEDDTEVFYQMGSAYDGPSSRGVRWNDPAFGIRWPMPVTVILDRDASYPDFAGVVP